MASYSTSWRRIDFSGFFFFKKSFCEEDFGFSFWGFFSEKKLFRGRVSRDFWGGRKSFLGSSSSSSENCLARKSKHFLGFFESFFLVFGKRVLRESKQERVKGSFKRVSENWRKGPKKVWFPFLLFCFDFEGINLGLKALDVCFGRNVRWWRWIWVRGSQFMVSFYF